jgi:hypothetical protein
VLSRQLKTVARHWASSVRDERAEERRAALQSGLDTTEYDRLVWRPDALGSICFLVSGYLAYLEVCGRPFCRPKASPMTRNELRRAIGGERRRWDRCAVEISDAKPPRADEIETEIASSSNGGMP